MRTFDLIVIGGGTGGLHVARTAKKAGWNVAIVDELPYGGTCALRGCDPKKMLVGATDALDWVRRMKGKGLNGDGVGVNWEDLMAFKRTFTEAMPPRIESGLERAGIEVLHGSALFVAKDRIEIDGRGFTAKNFHIATGATPRPLGIPGAELVSSSTDFLELAQLPKRIVFIGGGFISFEFAHIAARSGATVTIVHKHPLPLAQFDPDLVRMQVERTRALGITLHLDFCVDAVEAKDGALEVVCSGPGPERRVTCDLVVHGAGRVAKLEGLGLDVAGVEHGPRGIRVSKSLRSISNRAVFAAGDCADTSVPNLTPVSFYEARIAAKNLLAGEDAQETDYPPIPSAVFTIPPIARVGLLEDDAREAGFDFEVNFKETGEWYSSMRVAEKYSAFKVLVEKQTKKVLGAHFMGPGAEEQVNLLTMAMKADLTANQIKSVMFAYPSYASDIGSMV